jgi:fluoride ion exporter CrcB/FEX
MVYFVVTCCAVLYSWLMMPVSQLELWSHAIAGCNLRWLFYQLNYGEDHAHHLPIGTFLANAIACICIAFTHSPVFPLELKIPFSNGFCGGLSTFSTFAKELFHISTGSGDRPQPPFLSHYTSRTGRRVALTYFFLTVLLNQVVVVTILTALID